jgi:hypothetical protein
MLNFLCLLFAISSAAAFSLSPVLSAAGRQPIAQPRMALESLGYQTEAAGSARLVQEMGLADEISLLRAAVSRCRAEKDLDAQRTLLLQCQKVQHRLKANMKALREQVRSLALPQRLAGLPALECSLVEWLHDPPTPTAQPQLLSRLPGGACMLFECIARRPTSLLFLSQEAEMQALLRPVDGMLRQGGRIYSSAFDAQLAELDRELK